MDTTSLAVLKDQVTIRGPFEDSHSSIMFVKKSVHLPSAFDCTGFYFNKVFFCIWKVLIQADSTDETSMSLHYLFVILKVME